MQTLRRDWLTEAVFKELGLNPRQCKALSAARTERRLTNARYQRVDRGEPPDREA